LFDGLEFLIEHRRHVAQGGAHRGILRGSDKDAGRPARLIKFICQHRWVDAARPLGVRQHVLVPVAKHDERPGPQWMQPDRGRLTDGERGPRLGDGGHAPDLVEPEAARLDAAREHLQERPPIAAGVEAIALPMGHKAILPRGDPADGSLGDLLMIDLRHQIIESLREFHERGQVFDAARQDDCPPDQLFVAQYHRNEQFLNSRTFKALVEGVGIFVGAPVECVVRGFAGSHALVTHDYVDVTVCAVILTRSEFP